MKWLAVAAILLFSQAFADEPPAPDPALDKRVARIAAELRCLVCQNQSLADSNADLAVDLRRQVRELISAGKSDQEIRQYMVQRYGDFVLYRPPIKSTTVLLWAGPFVLLIVAAALLILAMLSRRARLADEELSPEERARAHALLSSAKDDRT